MAFKMMETLKKYKKIIYPALAALISAALITVIFASMKMAPFGESSILSMDMSQQYIDYFAGYRDVLAQGKSFLYTWNTGMGMDFLGLFGYYLSSPFSFIVLLFPKDMIVEAVTVMIIAKIAACGATFYYMLSFMRKRHVAVDIALAVMYALSTYNIQNAPNLMWLDGVIMLPLVIVGVEKLLAQRKMALFALSLLILFISNFYISFMVGIFVFMWFVFRIVCRYSEDIVKSCARFFGGVILAAASAAVLLIPVYFALKAAYGEMTDMYLPEQAIHTSFYVLFQRMLFASPDYINYMGSAHIYCGMLALILIPMYFFNKKISRREKAASAVIWLILIISMMVWVVSLVWHTFRTPQCFNYRFSFVYCCFVLILAQKVLRNLKGLRIRYIGISFAIIAGLTVFCIMSTDRAMAAAWSLKITLLLTAVYCLYVLVMKIGVKPAVRYGATALMFICLFFEMTFNGIRVLDWCDIRSTPFDDAEVYREAAELNRNMIATAESLETDDFFYRMENQRMRWSNDNFGNGYNGIAHYSSLSNRPTFAFMKNIGMLCCTNDRYLRYFGTTNLIDDLFGVKYVADRSGEKHGYSETAQYEDGVSLFKNENALPLGYAVSDSIEKLEVVDEGNPFVNQNKFLSALMGQNAEPFAMVDDFTLETRGLERDGDKNRYSIVGTLPEYIITFTAPESRNYYLWFDSDYDEHNTVVINDRILGRDVDDYLRAVIPLGYFEAGEAVKVEIRLTHPRDPGHVFDIWLAGLDNEMVDYCSSLLGSTSQGFIADGPNVKGKVNVPFDNGAVFMTIPYSDGWTAKVDGQPAEIKAVDNAFMAIPAGKGEHDIELKFVPKGLKTGACITVFGILAMIAALIFNDRRDVFDKAVRRAKCLISKRTD